MQKKWTVLLALALLLSACTPDDYRVEPTPGALKSPDFIIAGYLPLWSVETFDAEQASMLTDVILFSLMPTADGHLDTSEFANIDIDKIRQICNENNTRLLFCLGGWGRSDNFGKFAADPEKRRQFIDELYEYCVKNGFAGVDYDWEFPETPKTRKAYRYLLQETKDRFGTDLLVTFAMGSAKEFGSVENNLAVFNSIDRVHLMSYDHPGRHATLEKAQADIGWTRFLGCPKEKIVLGVPFYARPSVRVDNGAAKTALTLSQDYDLAAYPQVDEWDGYYFNNVRTLETKTKMAVEDGLGGMMYWAMSQDTEDNLLLSAMHNFAARYESGSLNQPGNPAKPELIMNHSSERFTEIGLQLQSWITSGRHEVTTDYLRDFNLTTVSFFEGQHAAPFNPAYGDWIMADGLQDLQWSITEAPVGEGIRDNLAELGIYVRMGEIIPPTQDMIDNGYLSAGQLKYLDRLTTVCFGDEEFYSRKFAEVTKEYFDLSRNHYPDALVHLNQYWVWDTGRQWQPWQYREFVEIAQPDLLTFDHYYFSQKGQTDLIRKRMGGSLLDIYRSTAYIRQFAIEGLTGDGTSPIPFGQYVLGFTTGDFPNATGSYHITESEIRGYSFATLTMGGKWLNYFRWLEDAPQISPIFEWGPDGKAVPSAGFYHYADAWKEARNLGKHLVRLSSTNISLIPGKHWAAGLIVDNTKPYNVRRWSAPDNRFIADISARNLGPTNDGLPGDVLIGYFAPLPGTAGSVIASEDDYYFMLMNGLTHGDGLPVEEQMGSADETAQQISVTLDFGDHAPLLQRVSRLNGKVEDVALEHLSGSQYRFSTTLGGGTADLFIVPAGWK